MGFLHFHLDRDLFNHTIWVKKSSLTTKKHRESKEQTCRGAPSLLLPSGPCTLWCSFLQLHPDLTYRSPAGQIHWPPNNLQHRCSVAFAVTYVHIHTGATKHGAYIWTWCCSILLSWAPVGYEYLSTCGWTTKFTYLLFYQVIVQTNLHCTG